MLALASENVRIDTRIICLLLVHYVNTMLRNDTGAF
jgi:hypothetical protein